MTTKVRIEWLKGRRPADFPAESLPPVDFVAKVLDVSGGPERAGPAPDFVGTPWGEARVTVIGGPVVMKIGADNTVVADQVSGFRLDVGSQWVQFKQGQYVSFVVATDAAV